jgi:sodium/potassium-transporting ATPase subunit alpha
MRVDNSSLTGESKMLLRSDKCTAPKNALDTENLAFFGTICKEGSGKAIIINTGDNTIIGQIANLAATANSAETPLKKELDRFIKIISIISIIMGIFFFMMGIILNYPFITCLIFGIGIIVANVPEGLLATVTVALALTAELLYTKSVLVKNIEAVETLGSTSCICSDKTGTLTQNKMTATHLWYNMFVYNADNL